jgi:uncharacterized protein (DUF2141 family)
MFHTLVILASLAAGTPAPSPSNEGAGAATNLELFLTSAAPKGRIMAALFNSGEAWKGGPPFQTAAVEPGSDKARLSFGALPPGRYALRVFQDLNGNGKLDVNPFGVPVEPFAFSNNAAPQGAPPAWDAAAFDVKGGPNRYEIALRSER